MRMQAKAEGNRWRVSCTDCRWVDSKARTRRRATIVARRHDCGPWDWEQYRTEINPDDGEVDTFINCAPIQVFDSTDWPVLRH